LVGLSKTKPYQFSSVQLRRSVRVLIVMEYRNSTMHQTSSFNEFQ